MSSMNVIRKNDENPNAVASILDPVQRTLTWIDPILQFLSKSTGEATVPAPLVARAMPWKDVETCHIQRLIEWGILVCVRKERNDTMEDWYKSSTTKRQSGSIAPQPSARFDWDDASCFIGFPSPGIERLHGCSKTAAKRRMAALLQRLNEETTQQTFPGTVTCDKPEQNVSEADMPDESKKIAYAVVSPGDESGRMTPTQLDSAPTKHNFEDNQFLYASEEAQIAFESLFGFSQISIQKDFDNPLIPTKILPHQASYAGSCPAQPSQYADLSQDCLRQIPPTLLKAFGLPRFRRLYSHQTAAIETVMSNRHCSICTGTGSGKSLCFLLPALTAAFVHNQTSLLLFPTKALAQDQLSKLLELLATDEELSHRIRPATLDGDTPYSARSRINECNIILTNPDTLHAAVLPSWKNKTYRSMLPSLRFIVIDEAHTYDGIFGAHVAMIVRRLIRVHAAASRDAGHGVMPTFVSASATLPWPEHHFRRLCAIPKHIPIRVLTGNEDGSPRSAKHFFVWNPPVLSVDGTSTDRVYFPRLTTLPEKKIEGRKRPLDTRPTNNDSDNTVDHNDVTSVGDGASAHSVPNPSSFFRRHAADETAGLLARAVTRGVRCIAFCKTRNLVEWVFQKTTEILKSDLYTSSLASRVESYRGGYTMKERRKIEEKMFRNEIIGIVGTNALELGIDLGGIDLTLHCGYPSSYSSLLQQAGRSGRSKERLHVPSVSVVVCFNSPAEQQLWRRPQSLLGKSQFPIDTVPTHGDLVQSHLLCASEEIPLLGDKSVGALISSPLNDDALQCDRELFGSSVYDEAIEALQSAKCLVEEEIGLSTTPSVHKIFKSRPSLQKAWSRVSIRSIEPVNYSVVDLSHPGQRGRMDMIHDSDAILDVLPYSRVFYHAHPGSIITHRGSKYKIISMTRPPAFIPENFNYKRNMNLAAFAKPTQARYSTRPLSTMRITVVMQMETVELREGGADIDEESCGRIINFAGCGKITVKREVHGYKKLSMITRNEISRTEISLPPIEYDTFGFFVCTDPDILAPSLGEKYGPGVHALSHAILAVAPMKILGLSRDDLECDHSFYHPTRITIFDERAGGSGCVERIWKCFFQPENILEEAINLLEECSLCCSDSSYDGGCPACIHASNCLKFNMHMSRSAAIIIGKNMLRRIRETQIYQDYTSLEQEGRKASLENDTTPRRKSRNKAMKEAKEMHSARQRQYVVGRPSWPLDNQRSKQEKE